MNSSDNRLGLATDRGEQRNTGDVDCRARRAAKHDLLRGVRVVVVPPAGARVTGGLIHDVAEDLALPVRAARTDVHLIELQFLARGRRRKLDVTGDLRER